METAAKSHTRRPHILLWSATIVAVVGMAGLAISERLVGARGGSAGAFLEPSTLVGRPLPAMALTDLDGHPVSTVGFGGRPVLINFWATWCIPCRAEMPELQHEWKQLGDRAWIVGVDEAESTDTITSFTTEIGVTYPVWRDLDNQVATALKAPGLPYSVFIDAQGKVQTVRIGIMDRAYIDAHLRKLLASK